ncbi:M-phase inducer phosphatase-like [Haliotis cracherodii]|uniref:M-phase inducer phosphatase-like n=1 Tax=Haliotis cracherodii TaxID=6455 RepID=UPI0039E82ACC
MKSAVDKMEQGTDLIGDGSQNHCLPTIQGRHKDLKSVAPHTVSKLLAGQYDDVISSYRIIDCRYPYEYEGGHIEGAENLHNETLIKGLVTSLQEKDSIQRNILVFHCEFSSERGPKLLRCLRNLDRKVNSDRYPFLFYPEVYLLDGGYKAFYEQHQTQCQPRNYVPMLHQDFSKQLRHFRVKSKSWTAGEKQSMRSRRLIIDTSPLKMPLWRTDFRETRNSLFGEKRRRDDDGVEDHILARQMKKLKTTNGVHKAQTEVTSEVMKTDVDQMEQGTDLIGEGSKGAENLHNEALITDLVTSLQRRDSTQRNILVFHCEFSSERGPKL